MKLLTTVLFSLLSLAAHAGEENFTIRIEHLENERQGRSEAAAGRRWDIHGLLRSFAGDIEWVKSGEQRQGAFAGTNYCLRLRQTDQEQRSRSLENLVSQLQLRRSEMREGRALYRVTYPSHCGETRSSLAHGR